MEHYTGSLSVEEKKRASGAARGMKGKPLSKSKEHHGLYLPEISFSFHHCLVHKQRNQHLRLGGLLSFETSSKSECKQLVDGSLHFCMVQSSNVVAEAAEFNKEILDEEQVQTKACRFWEGPKSDMNLQTPAPFVFLRVSLVQVHSSMHGSRMLLWRWMLWMIPLWACNQPTYFTLHS